MPSLQNRLQAIILLVPIFCLNALGSRSEFARVDDDAAIRNIVEQFFVAYQKKDLDALMSLWSEHAANVAAVRQEFQQTFSDYDSINAKSLVIDKLTINTEKAKVQLTIEVSAIDRKTGKPATSFGRLSRIMELVEEGKAWKIVRYVSAEEDFVNLLAAANEQERKSLLDRNGERVTRELVRELNKRGRIFFSQSKFGQALELYEIGLVVATKLNDKTGASLILIGVGNLHYVQGNYQQAADAYQRSLTLAEEAGSKPEMGRALSSMGTLLFAQGNYSHSLELYLKSMKLREELGDKAGIGILLGNIAGIYYSQGNYDQALEYQLRGLKLAEELGDKSAISTALFNTGALYLIQGDYLHALDVRMRNLNIKEQLQDKPGLTYALNGIGEVYYQHGDYQQALEFYKKGLEVSIEIGQKSLTAACTSNIGNAYYAQGDYDRALEFMQKGLKLNEELGDKSGVATSWNNLGALYNDQGNHLKALDTLQQSLRLAEELGFEQIISSALANISETYQYLGQYQKALDYGQQAVALARQRENTGVLWQALTAAGQAHAALNQTDLAQNAFLEAIAIIEKLREQTAGGERGRERFFESKVAPYYAMIDLAIKRQDPAQALAYAERAKGRVLLDVLSNGRVKIGKAMTLEEINEDRRLIGELNGLNTQILRLKSTSKEGDLSALNAQLEQTRLEYEAFQSSLYATHPELKVQRGQAHTITMDEAAMLLPDNETALLEYIVGENTSYLLVMTKAVDQGSKGPVLLEAYPLNITRKDLSARAENFRKSIVALDLNVRMPARQLYDLLVKPVEKQLHGVNRLVVIPDGPLWDLPFQALYSDQKGYLLEGYSLSYAPSLSVLREMDRKASELTSSKRPPDSQHFRAASFAKTTQPVLLAFGNPTINTERLPKISLLSRDEPLDPLPDAEREVNTLARIYGRARSTVLIGNKATEEELKAKAGKYRLLHLATHAILDDRDPMYSRIMLSYAGDQAKEDGQLEAWELMNLDLKADMVVLSACQTASGRVGSGEGIIGMSWALFVAGSPTVVASQWKVESARTTELMLEFHRNLLRRKPAPGNVMTKAEALREAALKLLHSRYNHPAYWAGFVLIGNEK